MGAAKIFQTKITIIIAMSTGLLTLQFGTTSNFVGSHFWNLQEELRFQQSKLKDDEFCERSLSLLYRISENSGKNAPTYSPRCVIFDYSSGYGFLSSQTSGIKKESVYHQTQKLKYLQSLAPTISNSSSASGIELFVQHPGRGPSQYHQYMSDLIYNPEEVIYKKISKRSEKSRREELEGEGEGEDEEKMEDQEVSTFQKVELSEEAIKEEQKKLIQGEEKNHDSVHKQFESGLFSKYWSDFCKATFNSKSLQVVSPSMIENNEISNSKWDEFIDYSRFFLEECDSFEGFINICDTSHLSFGKTYLQKLKDEVGGKSPIFSFFVAEDPISNILSYTDDRYSPLFPVNFMDYFDVSSVVVPMNFHSVSDDTNFLLFSKNHYNPQLRYHSSSVIASSISTLLDPITLRNKEDRISLDRYLRLFPVLPIQKIAIPSLALPLPIRKNTDTLYSILDTMSPLHHSNQMCGISGFFNNNISEEAMRKRKYLSQSVVTKGLHELPLYDPLTESTESLSFEEKVMELFRREVLKKNKGDEDKNNRRKILDNCRTNREMFRRFLEQTRTYSSTSYFSERPLYLSDTFPQYFSSDLKQDGFLERNEKKSRKRIYSLPVISSLQNSSALGEFMKENIMKTTNGNLKRIISHSSGDLDMEEMMEYTEKMANFVDSYDNS